MITTFYVFYNKTVMDQRNNYNSLQINEEFNGFEISLFMFFTKYQNIIYQLDDNNNLLNLLIWI